MCRDAARVPRRPLLVAVCLLVAAGFLARQVDAPTAAPADSGGPVVAGAGAIVAVLDGDTVIVQMAGYDGPVRIVGIDTPEVAHRGAPAACFGEVAAASVRAWLLGRQAHVEPAREQRDRYGRLLARIAPVDGPIAGRDLARVLALSGLARALPIAPNLDDARAIDEAVAVARRNSRGLWGACGQAQAFPQRR